MKITIMKRIFAVIIFASTIGGASAQKNNVQSAANSFKYEEYGEGKKYIDLAAKHPKTANSAKMWYYRGRIYLSIHESGNTTMDGDAIAKSVRSLVACIDVDETEMYTDSAQMYLMNAAIKCFVEGVNKYEGKDYSKSSELYGLVLKTLDYDENKNLARNNVSEKTIYLNLYYAASGAEDKGKSKEYLRKLIELNYNDPNIYRFMCQILLEEEDTAGALSYIEKGRERFYDDRDLIIEQVNLSIKMGKSEELLLRMSEDIEYDVGNSTLYLVRGILYEKKGDQEAAKKDYLEALELNPGYFIAAFNLGAMCYDAGAEILTAAKDILDNTKYAQEKEKAMVLFKEGIPYLEAALEIDPTDDAAAQRLVRMYARTGDTDKYNALKAKMEGM